MPRVYKPQLRGRRNQSYDQETLLKALDMIRKEKIGIRAASRKFGIPVMTLSTNVSIIYLSPLQ